MPKSDAREAYEKRKTSTKPEKQGMSPKDWLTTSFSAIAISLSLTTAYFTVIRIEDNVSVVASGVPNVMLSGTEIVLFERPMLFALFNSGNRAASIRSLKVTVRFDMTYPAWCLGGRPVFFDTDFESLVMKPSEIVERRVKLKRGADTALAVKPDGFFPDSWRIPMPETENWSTISVCLDTTIVSPSIAEFRSRHLLIEYTRRGNELDIEPWLARVVPDGSIDRPIILMRRYGTIFNR